MSQKFHWVPLENFELFIILINYYLLFSSTCRNAQNRNFKMVRVTCKLLEESASSDRFSKEEQEERRKDGNLFNICVYQFERLKNSVQLLWFKNEVRHDESRRSPEELEEIVKAVEDLRKKLLACVLSGTKDDALSWTSNFMECMTLAGQ